MASINIPATKRRIDDAAEAVEFLTPYGIRYERWDVEGRIGPDATNEQILAAYAPEIERLKREGGYVTADVINVTPETPGLDAMLAKFDKEHTHSEDEVRFTVKGTGVFWINPTAEANGTGGDIFAIEVTAGDLISVPAGTQHWFHLCDDRTIRCIRLFEDTSGWTPEYLDAGKHTDHAPVCWGGSYLPKVETIDNPVRIAD